MRVTDGRCPRDRPSLNLSAGVGPASHARNQRAGRGAREEADGPTTKGTGKAGLDPCTPCSPVMAIHNLRAEKSRVFQGSGCAGAKGLSAGRAATHAALTADGAPPALPA